MYLLSDEKNYEFLITLQEKNFSKIKYIIKIQLKKS
jgi:hypothetical protein